MPTLRLSVQRSVPTATHAMSAIQYFAPSQKYVHAEEIALLLSPLMPHLPLVKCVTSAASLPVCSLVLFAG